MAARTCTRATSRSAAAARRAPLPAAAALPRRVACAAEVETSIPMVAPSDVKDHLDRGFLIVDIRSPQEQAETGTKYGTELIPLAAMTEEGPVFNQYWLSDTKAKFPNAMSRILICCDDGTDRSEIAYEKLTGEPNNYTQVKVLEGGFDAYVEEFPLDDRDKIKWKMSDDDRAGPDLGSLLNGVDTNLGAKYDPNQRYL